MGQLHLVVVVVVYCKTAAAVKTDHWASCGVEADLDPSAHRADDCFGGCLWVVTQAGCFLTSVSLDYLSDKMLVWNDLTFANLLTIVWLTDSYMVL